MKWLNEIVKWDTLAKIVASVIATVVVTATKAFSTSIRGRLLASRLKEDRYTSEGAKRRIVENKATYVEPDCQSSNFVGQLMDECDRRPILQEIDRLLGPPERARMIFVLADTGMGKSTFLDTYYKRHWSSPIRCRRFRLVLLNANDLDTKSFLKKLDADSCVNTVLLVDALDEDGAAVEDFAGRMKDLTRFAGHFLSVVITCRTQFITDSSWLPSEMEMSRHPGPMSLSDAEDKPVQTLYLSPFSRDQVWRFLDARFPWWRYPRLRRRAGKMAIQFEDVMSRPLLLGFIKDLVSADAVPRLTCQLYERIVAGWISRERKKHFSRMNPEELLEFSECFATALFSTGRDAMPLLEVTLIAKRFHVEPVLRETWERSLITNDADGSWRFVHRSIMEYFIALAVVRSPDRPSWVQKPWTSQMRIFVVELLTMGGDSMVKNADLRHLDLRQINLSGRDLADVKLLGTDLRGANLKSTNLRHVDLRDANVEGSMLSGTDLTDACIENANLRATDLSAARGLTLRQASAALSDERTRWPSLVLTGHTKAVSSIALSSNGSRAISAGADRTLRLWKVSSGEQTGILRGHSDEVTSVANAYGWRRALSGGKDGTVRLWDLQLGQQLRSVPGHSCSVLCVDITPDGRRGMSSDEDGTIKLWDLENSVLEKSWLGHQGKVYTCQFLEDGKRAISGASDCDLRIWNIESGDTERVLSGHTGAVSCLAVAGEFVVSGSYDKTIRLWDVENGSLMHTFWGHGAPVSGVKISADGAFAISVSIDGNLKTWDIQRRCSLSPVIAQAAGVNAVALTRACSHYRLAFC